MWKNFVQPGSPQMIIWRMRIACWIPKATNAYAVCVILIAAPLQQWLNERAIMLCYTYNACLVLFILPSLYRQFMHSLCGWTNTPKHFVARRRHLRGVPSHLLTFQHINLFQTPVRPCIAETRSSLAIRDL